jgi:hypothetical protein
VSYTGDLFIDRQHKNLFLHWQHQRRRRWFLISGGAPRRPGKPPGNREGERVPEEQIITLKPLNSSGKPEERRRRRARPATGVGGDAWIPSIHGFPTSVDLWRRSCSSLGDVDHARGLCGARARLLRRILRHTFVKARSSSSTSWKRETEGAEAAEGLEGVDLEEEDGGREVLDDLLPRPRRWRTAGRSGKTVV